MKLQFYNYQNYINEKEETTRQNNLESFYHNSP